jgi:hypothetical protein
VTPQFQPKDLPDLLEDYFAECLKAGSWGTTLVELKKK